MTTTTQLLLDTVVSLLSTPAQVDDEPVYPTAAAGRVYAPRDWPTVTGEYPAILASAPNEQKESAGRNQPQFTVTSTIRLLVRVDAPANVDDGSAGPVQDALWSIQRQIETTLIGNPALFGVIQQIAAVRTELGFNSGGEKHLGELGVEFDMEFFQSAWAFYRPSGSPLTEVTVATAAQDQGSAPGGAHIAPGLNLTLPS